MNEKHVVRPPAVAGMFYKGSPASLCKNVDELLEDARVPEIKGTIRALVSPHAGYVYSGFTAAHAYKPLRGRNYDCVIAVGPSHREYFDGISIFNGDDYETPLGKVPICEEMRSELLKIEKTIVSSTAGHRSEHSIEVQLPFLQRVLGEFTLVPIIIGDQRKQLCFKLADAIARVKNDRNILLVASSDLSHYHSYDDAVRLDKRVIDAIVNFDPDAFMDELEEKSFEACGGGPIAAIMKAAQQLGAKNSAVLHYCNSGDVTGDKSAVVGYLAAAFFD